jgi:spore germination protein KA
MELTFEILREAGIRMPRAIGPAISIVGALVLGQAAVEAGIISAGVVIVVSITAISSFAITNYGMSNAIRLLRFGTYIPRKHAWALRNNNWLFWLLFSTFAN